MTKHLEKITQAVQSGLLAEGTADNLRSWLEQDRYSACREELTSMIDAGEWESLGDAFYQLIPFGTGGRRGKVGLGTNRMNSYTIADSVQGMANKLAGQVKGHRAKVVIAYDTRLTSAEFTLTSAEVLAGNGIEVFLFDGPRSTPQLSFAIRDLGCDAGIVISASHNPPEDNGFKAYWGDGGQVVPPLDAELIEEVRKVDEVKSIPFEQAYGEGLIHRLGKKDDDRYVNALLKQSLYDGRKLKIVYSPLHGTGTSSILPLLEKAGFEDIHIVESQKDPDGRFPNVPGHKPNPEVTTGLDASIALARAIGADLAMVSDPDADRLSCAVASNDNQDFTILTGNQCAALMMEFIARRMKEAGTLKPSLRVYTTIVSSPLFPTIARQYGLTVKDDLLVGFKWIAQQIEMQNDPGEFLFGSEESIGFMKGSQTRDKDAAVAALVFSELASMQKAKGETVLDLLDEIYRSYGYFCDLGTSIFLEGAKGGERMSRIMAALRDNPPKNIGEAQVVSIIDRLNGTIKNVDGEEISKVDGPCTNLLVFRLREDGKSWIAIRPSGTEPKIKFYFSLFAPVKGDLKELKLKQRTGIEALMEATTKLAMAIE